ncbi:MAG: helix-turn-helix transcriptional regulator [Synergistaceae bacterium]|nr:helix-turn-helix transcriptional regulator [Synergistaceae bacterium]
MYIREWRKKRGLTQEQLAEMANIHVNTLLRWEYGTREPKASELQKLAKILNCTEAELLNGPAKQELEVKIMMGVKSLTGLAGIEVANNSFIYGVQDDEPQIVLAGKVRIDTPEARVKAREAILKKFDAACWMYDHKGNAEA